MRLAQAKAVSEARAQERTAAEQAHDEVRTTQRACKAGQVAIHQHHRCQEHFTDPEVAVDQASLLI